MREVEGFFLAQPEVDKVVGVLGFSFSGQGQNAALAFVTLKDWSERSGKEHSAEALAGRAFGALSGLFLGRALGRVGLRRRLLRQRHGGRRRHGEECEDESSCVSGHESVRH